MVFFVRMSVLVVREKGKNAKMKGFGASFT